MFSLFKRILPILKNRLFGTGTGTTQAIGSVIYCQTLYVTDQNLQTFNIINNLDKDLFIVNEMNWSINDGCSRSS